MMNPSTRIFRKLLLLAIVVSLAFPAYAASRKSPLPPELKRYTEELKKNPSNGELREKIIKLVVGMKHAPSFPEEAERNFVRGTTFLQKAKDVSGYKRAIKEFSAAIDEAPWFALAYYNLAIAQEKAGLYAGAIDNLNYYLLAEPGAKNARDVKNKIYALEADVEILQQREKAPSSPASTSKPLPETAVKTTPDKSLDVAGKPTLDIEPVEADLNILKLPAEKKAKLPNFTGTWYFKDALRGEELVIEAFEIGKNGNGDLIVTPPKRVADSYASVTRFDINDRNLKLQLRWKMKSVVGYWKLETYDLTLSADGKTLSGSHNQKSVGGRDISMDRTLFRQ
jgi:tetratricopeptide (TPR) repeat protein